MDKFLELQAVMWRTNAGLTDRHAYDSRPNHWPWLRRGIVSLRGVFLFARADCTPFLRNKNFWVKEHRQIYLIGNPVIWWSSSLAITVYLLFRGFLILRNQRGYRDLRNRKPGRSELHTCSLNLIDS
jgi:dolichyl-phosphate-mannose-protein mannosyltransferase